MMRLRGIRRLKGDIRGATLLEFAFVAPVMLLLLMGLSDIMYRAYVQSVLEGAMQKAGRDSSLEGAANKGAAIDAAVMAIVHDVAKSATHESSRKAFSSYSALDPEPFTDANANKKYDKGECFDDMNGNKLWDADLGSTGQGAANDVVLYEMVVTYPRIFPVFAFMGGSEDQVIRATTILKNQPFTTRDPGTTTTICV